MNPQRTKVLLVDDQVLFVESLRCVLEDRAHEMEIVGVAHDGNEAVLMTIKLKPEIILMDVRMPGMDGVQATREIHQRFPEIKILMLTTFNDDEYVKVALKFGALGYLLKNIKPDELIRSIRSVRHAVAQIAPEVMAKLLQSNSEIPGPEDPTYVENLTPREKDVLDLCVKAFSNQNIADRLGVSEQTVKNHIHNIYSKLGVSNRLELIKLMGNKGGE